jgi:hypothetical protein
MEGEQVRNERQLSKKLKDEQENVGRMSVWIVENREWLLLVLTCAAPATPSLRHNSGSGGKERGAAERGATEAIVRSEAVSTLTDATASTLFELGSGRKMRLHTLAKAYLRA